MCLLCSAATADRDRARRSHVLGLLALVEHPDALPADAALHLAHEILRLTRTDGAVRRCDEVTPPETHSAVDQERPP